MLGIEHKTLRLQGIFLASSIYVNLERIKKVSVQNKMQNKIPLDLPSMLGKKDIWAVSTVLVHVAVAQV